MREREKERYLFHNNGDSQLFHFHCIPHKVDLASFFFLSLHLTGSERGNTTMRITMKKKIWPFSEVTFEPVILAKVIYNYKVFNDKSLMIGFTIYNVDFT